MAVLEESLDAYLARELGLEEMAGFALEPASRFDPEVFQEETTGESAHG